MMSTSETTHPCSHSRRRADPALLPLVPHSPRVISCGFAAQNHPDLTSSLQQLASFRCWRRASLSPSVFDSVEHIDVSAVAQEDEHVEYQVSVFLALPSSRLPSTHSVVTNLYKRRRYPSEHLECPSVLVCSAIHRYSAFYRLRSALKSQIARCQCTYCLNFTFYLFFRGQQPDALHKFIITNAEHRRKMLDVFLNDVIALAQAPEYSFDHLRGGTCGTRERVQAVLAAFLFE